MPMQRDLYPPDWDAIALAVKEAAGWQCVVCGRPCRKPGEDIDAFIARSYERGWWGRPVTGVSLSDWERIVKETPVRFVLTVMHLDHNPANCDPANLRAACSGCHLRYDAEHHAKNAAKTRRRKAEQAGQRKLIETE